MACAALAGCTGGSSSDSSSESSIGDTNSTSDSSNSNSTAVDATGVVSGVTSGRLLASNCYQCHGTYGSGGFDKIMGKGDLLGEMREYAASTNTNDIMAAHTQGYTDAQLQAIASYLANL
jgi:cytochrome c553